MYLSKQPSSLSLYALSFKVSPIQITVFTCSTVLTNQILLLNFFVKILIYLLLSLN